MLKGKNVALVVNHTSKVKDQHLINVLLAKSIKIKKIFSLEHGFYLDKGAGKKISTQHDYQAIPIISLYGKKKAPSQSDLSDIDWVVFDIQDVGVRFFTYISSLGYIMEAVAKGSKKMMVLDRPNPNIHYMAGPILEKPFTSFVGLYPIPIVYGMSIGELARMIDGEQWLSFRLKEHLKIIPCKNYSRSVKYELPLKPSPNLGNMLAILLYPSLCLFEGTIMSVGRGTLYPFQTYGHPLFEIGNHQFTPKPIKGMALNPKHVNKKCYAKDLRGLSFQHAYRHQWDLSYLIESYNYLKSIGLQESFFTPFFDKLAGTSALRKMIQEGKTAKEINLILQADIRKFNRKKQKYLLYQ